MIIIHNEKELHGVSSIGEIVDFLYKHLDRFGDSKQAIRKAINYAISNKAGRGGFLTIAKKDNEIVGALVMNKTGMSDYIPANVLVYVAVRADQRGKGLGSKIIKKSLAEANGKVKLHVEYDNPAKKLYERIGFKSKYAEMRYTKEK